MPKIFRNRNFNLLFTGRLFTNVGFSLFIIVTLWFVQKKTDSTFETGLATFLMLLPTSLQFLIGPLVDKLNLLYILTINQTIQFLLALSIAVMYIAGDFSFVYILTTIVLISFLGKLDNSVEVVTLPRLISNDLLIQANSAISFASKGIDLIVNALAGVLLLVASIKTIYVMDSIPFFLALIVFLFLRIPSSSKDVMVPQHGLLDSINSYKDDIKEGMNIVKKSILWKFMAGSIVINVFLGVSYAILPAFCDLRGGPIVYSAFLIAQGIGSVVGSLLSIYAAKFRIGRMVSVLFAIGSSTWIIAAFSPFIWLSVAMYGLTWVPLILINIVMQSSIQKIVPNNVLGRVFTISGSISAVAMPLGALIGGFLGEHLMIPLVFASGALGYGFLSLYWISNSELRSLPSSKNISSENYGF